MLAAQSRPNTSTPGDASRTITIHDVQPRPESSDSDSAGPSIPEGTLRLHGGPRSRPRVMWDEGVIDNENCGRKKSKICCIYHKPKDFDESSDESSDEDSDSMDDGHARPHDRRHRHHPHNDRDPDISRWNGTPDPGDGLRNGDDSIGGVHELEDRHEPNAYESQPSHSKKEKGCANT